ncbi:MAG TPA: ABC transporter permease [Mesotoga infera]|nr:ABC transporter permease [Thermotogaceae bacterium]HNR79626.1 ABC transporter permease [Mesotoga infera]HOI64191.1 ABC transporter permease [Mesotoga sp.]HNS66628.1 ABC transporter permease [Mesotoga infera]HPD39084.1 ABC transporter permease [Mesotoga infera]
MYIYLRKLFAMLATVFLVSMITFVTFEIIPGDPVLARLGVDADEAKIRALSEELGLDEPLSKRFFGWITGLFTGDLGQSIRYSRPVSELILDRLPVTLSLALISMALIVIIGVPLGILSARYGDRLPGILISVISQIGMAVPSFWTGIILMYIFGLTLRWVSPGGYTPWSVDPVEAFKSLLLPAVAIALPSIAAVIRYTRNTVMEQMKNDYVRLAFSKGLKMNAVLFRHVLKNALIPVITVLGMITANILGGSIVIEQVFTLPGVGRLLINAISVRDLPLVQGMVLYISLVIVVTNFLIDIVYTLIDPRIKLR